MRATWTYRAMFRNAHHDLDRLFRWKRLNAVAIYANSVAKLAERRKQCTDARDSVMMIAGAQRFTTNFSTVNAILTTFWQAQKFTRVVARILRELAKPQHHVLMFR